MWRFCFILRHDTFCLPQLCAPKVDPKLDPPLPCSSSAPCRHQPCDKGQQLAGAEARRAVPAARRQGAVLLTVAPLLPPPAPVPDFHLGLVVPLHHLRGEVLQAQRGLQRGAHRVQVRAQRGGLRGHDGVSATGPGLGPGPGPGPAAGPPQPPPIFLTPPTPTPTPTPSPLPAAAPAPTSPARRPPPYHGGGCGPVPAGGSGRSPLPGCTGPPTAAGGGRRQTPARCPRPGWRRSGLPAAQSGDTTVLESGGGGGPWRRRDPARLPPRPATLGTPLSSLPY